MTFLLVAGPSWADDATQRVPRPRPFWAKGPAGGPFGAFVEVGATAGWYGVETFAAASLGLGVSLRFFEASVTGFGGSSLDGAYGGSAFLARAALRIPVSYVAFTFGPELGYVEVPGHLVSGVALDPLAVGVEIDPVCHLRIGLLGAYAYVDGDAPQGTLRGALTVGFILGRCPAR